MSQVLLQLGQGFIDCFTPIHLLMLFVGIVIGLLIGVLPGLTLVMGVALALPFTYHMDVTASIVLLSAMYVSGTYGGAFTAILFRIPGEPIDVPMLWDGYTMGRKGQAAKALGWTLIAALGGGLLSATVMVLLTQPLAVFALRFSTPEYFAVLLFGLSSVVALGSGSLANALISLSVGLLIATVGTDETYGSSRFTFGSPILADGIEGGAIYALSAPIRDAVLAHGEAVVHVALRPDLTASELAKRFSKPRQKQSMSTYLRKAAGLSSVAIGLMQEAAIAAGLNLSAMDSATLAAFINAVPVRLKGVAPLERAISTAGGISFEDIDANFMLRKMPGLFVAGEMLDWEAPTGGYLLQACFATGAAAARGALEYLKR